LEIGTAIGYSAIAMARCGAAVTTVERDADLLRIARENVTKYGFDGRVTVIGGDAGEVLKRLDGEFDFIFLDAAKAQYREFFPHCMRLLKRGGVLLSDNVLYKGMVATDELAVRRKITIIKRLRRYLDELCAAEELVTSIIPIGDGCALSYKIGL
jgi:predicted O-methyltransferase YrrM